MATRYNTGEEQDDNMDIKSYDAETNLASVTATLRKILQTTAETSEEKFKVLDARDKLYKIMRDKDPSLKRRALVALCPDMCPEKERLLREYQGRGSIFEMTNYSKNSTFNHSLAVKEYARSSADQEEPLPHDLRPVNVLTMTMSHLLHNVIDFCELTDDNLEEWYMFMWDRTRALRKELTQQGVCSLDSVTLVEQCARFHIHCAERLIDQDTSIYDDKINTENLTKCLQTLKYMYKDLAKEDVKCPNEPEFICYTLLLNLNNSSVFTELSDMSNSTMTSEPVKFALDVMTTWETRNYIRFFNLVKKTTYLNCCLLRRYFGEMRLYAIKTMIRSYCTKTYSPQIVISRFVDNLNFEGEEECLTFLSHCNFNFHEIDRRTVVNFDRVLFQIPKTRLASGRAYLFIEDKKQRPLSVIMAGGSLPPKLYENHVPQNSFSDGGELNRDSLPLDLFNVSAVPSPPVKSGGFGFKMESSKMATGTLDIFQKEGEPTRDPRSKDSGKPSTFSSPFIFKEPHPPPSNIFGSVQPSTFGKMPESGNIFGRSSQAPAPPVGNQSGKNIFGNQGPSSLAPVARFQVFGAQEPKPGFGFAGSSPGQSDKTRQTFYPPAVREVAGGLEKSPRFGSSLEEAKSKEERERSEREREKERAEEEKKRREKEEEERRRRREEEERAQLVLEKKKLEEEREKRERARREEEERMKVEELARAEREERSRREEKARQERLRAAEHLAEVKRQEEKRKIELEYKRRVDDKMSELKKKLRKWKTKIVFDKWRMETWTRIEERKMKVYLKEVKLKYPPVCTEEALDGNPHGLLIPSLLVFDKFHGWRGEGRKKRARKFVILNDDLPLLKVDSLLGKPLEDRARSLGSKTNPFPWKVVISVPDEAECPDNWKDIETFVEMHFVDNFQWEFGTQTGPLYCRSSSRGSFQFKTSIRRVRGCGLYEGTEANPTATTGSNALVFFLTENGNEVTWERLKTILKSRAPLPKIPVIVIDLLLTGRPKEENPRRLLDSSAWDSVSEFHVIPVFGGDHRLVNGLIEGLALAAARSAPPPSLKTAPLSAFFNDTWLDSLWRGIEISLSNFKVNLHEPKVLIEFHNSCIDELGRVLLDPDYEGQTTLAEEFAEGGAERPAVTPAYRERLTGLLDRVKLPHWPAETPKSCHQLNYRIHQYCKKVAGQDRRKTKDLKWILYRIIRRSLLWKGLDIYCDDDVRQILVNFPWIQVFQEISRVLTRQLGEEIRRGKNVAIVYDPDKVEKFSFDSSLIGKFLRRSKGHSPRRFPREWEAEDPEELDPRVEKDSVVFAYSAAIERETSKRKREEGIEESLDALFSTPAGKRIVIEEEESRTFDLSEMESNFRRLSDRLDALKKKLAENSKTLSDVHNTMQ